MAFFDVEAPTSIAAGFLGDNPELEKLRSEVSLVTGDTQNNRGPLDFQA
jgi:hypothetical protein